MAAVRWGLVGLDLVAVLVAGPVRPVVMAVARPGRVGLGLVVVLARLLDWEPPPAAGLAGSVRLAVTAVARPGLVWLVAVMAVVRLDLVGLLGWELRLVAGRPMVMALARPGRAGLDLVV